MSERDEIDEAMSQTVTVLSMIRAIHFSAQHLRDAAGLSETTQEAFMVLSDLSHEAQSQLEEVYGLLTEANDKRARAMAAKD